MSTQALEEGYWRAYREFYRWGAILQGAWSKPSWNGRARHLAYAAGWKKFEPAWDWIIRARRVGRMLPFLEAILAARDSRQNDGRLVSATRAQERRPAGAG